MRDLTTAIISLVVLLGVAAFLQRSRTGKAIRAVSDNPSLASSTGIDTQKIIRVVWFAGGALAAMGGVFRGLDEQVGFEMGSGLIFLMFAGITLGGLGSAYGALIGGFFVGLLVELASLVVQAELTKAEGWLIWTSSRFSKTPSRHSLVLMLRISRWPRLDSTFNSDIRVC
jgi:branched-chain amino acid transport system permease protein